MDYWKLCEIIDDLKLPNDMKFIPGWFTDEEAYHVRIRKENDVCNVTRQPGYSWEGRRWVIEPHYDESHVLRTLWACFMATMEHELREQFIYKGKLPFGPHFDIADVMAKADTVAA